MELTGFQVQRITDMYGGTSVARTANHTDIWKLGLGYEMPCGPVDAMNPEKVAEECMKLLKEHALVAVPHSRN
jgi:hypothetical protein